MGTGRFCWFLRRPLELQDWTLTDDFAEVDIAGLENEGLDNGGPDIDGRIWAQVGSAGSVRRPLDSMRAAMLTVSPKRQYRGMMLPTTPATTGPVCRPAATPTRVT